VNHQVSPLKEYPAEVKSRLNCWHKLYRRANITHYSVGIIGVAASTLAAVDIGEASRFLAAISAVCIAILGFAKPERKYIKFVRAWRTLDAAALRYRYGKTNLDALFNAMEQGERCIAEFEQDLSGKAQDLSPG
jgi:hypothetical protein